MHTRKKYGQWKSIHGQINSQFKLFANPEDHSNQLASNLNANSEPKKIHTRKGHSNLHTNIFIAQKHSNYELTEKVFNISKLTKLWTYIL